MRHVWENNKCLRCGIGREQKSEKVDYGFSMGSYIRHYTIYYVNGIRVNYKPKCYYKNQLTINFDDKG